MGRQKAVHIIKFKLEHKEEWTGPDGKVMVDRCNFYYLCGKVDQTVRFPNETYAETTNAPLTIPICKKCAKERDKIKAERAKRESQTPAAV